MGNVAGKIWGQTELILANSSCEFHRIDFVKGGVCSKHKHEWKWNGFYVMSVSYTHLTLPTTLQV